MTTLKIVKKGASAEDQINGTGKRHAFHPEHSAFLLSP